MIDRHWDGIAAYCRLENKVSLGFVEGLNNKIRVIQRRAYGLRNEAHSAVPGVMLAEGWPVVGGVCRSRRPRPGADAAAAAIAFRDQPDGGGARLTAQIWEPKRACIPHEMT